MKKNETKKTEKLETVDAIALEDVTGGCSRCGCGQPDAPGAQLQQFGAKQPQS
jgi:hypothetical protein